MADEITLEVARYRPGVDTEPVMAARMTTHTHPRSTVAPAVVTMSGGATSEGAEADTV